MERFIKEPFRTLFANQSEKGNDIHTELYTELIKNYRVENPIDYKNINWRKYGISEKERENIMLRFSTLGECYRIDASLANMKKDSLTKKDKFLLELFNTDTKVLLSNMISSHVVNYDIVDEIYLVYKKRIATKEILKTGLSESFEETAKNYIDNHKKGRTNKRPFVYMPLFKTDKIESFGSAIVRLWLGSAKFRKLYPIVGESVAKKYQLSEFLQSDIQGTLDNEETNIFLNKLVGGNVIVAFYKYICPSIEKFSNEDIKKYVNPLVSKIMELDAGYLKCEIIKVLGIELREIQELPDEYKIKRLFLYMKYLNEIIPNINKQYAEICKCIVNTINAEWDEKYLEEYLSLYKPQYDRDNLYRIKYNKLHEYFFDENELDSDFYKKYDDEEKRRTLLLPKNSFLIYSIIRKVIENCSQRYVTSK